MVKITNIIIFILIFLYSCTKPTPYEVAEKKVLSKLIQEAKVYYDLKFELYDSSFDSTQVPIHIYFTSYQRADVYFARRLLVENVENLINIINSEDEIANFLLHYPIDPKDFSFSILFSPPEDPYSFRAPPDLASVLLSDGIVTYSIFNSKNDSLKIHFNESYRRAKGIVEHQNSLMNLPPECAESSF